MSEIELTALSVDDMLMVLQRAGADVTDEMLATDIEEGAPLNDDGTMNFFEYGAWLARRV